MNEENVGLRQDEIGALNEVVKRHGLAAKVVKAVWKDLSDGHKKVIVEQAVKDILEQIQDTDTPSRVKDLGDYYINLLKQYAVQIRETTEERYRLLISEEGIKYTEIGQRFPHLFGVAEKV